MKIRHVLAGLVASIVSFVANADSIQFTATSVTTTEGVASVNILVSRTTPAVGQTASVTWTTVDGEAHAGTDFGAPGVPGPITGTLSWAAGIGGSKTINLLIANDTAALGTRTFRIQLSDAVGAGVIIGTNNNIQVKINDNDKGFSFASPTYEVNEQARTIALTVNRIGPATTAATATWATANGTAIAGQDFGTLDSPAQRTGTLSWLAGEAAPKTIVIPIIDDTVGGEGDETFTVSLTASMGYILGVNPVATVTIHDNDPPPESALQFTQPKYSVLENAGTVTLNVERVDIGGGLARAASVTYSTVAGTALATSDFITKTGTVSWAAGEGGVKPITISIVNNAIAEPIKVFTVKLGNPSAYVGLQGPQSASVLIVDDDEKFPPAGAMPAWLKIPVDATKGFHVSADPTPFEGAYSIKSDFIEDGQSAGIEMTGTSVTGSSVSFRVKVSTEAAFDVLTFYVDGTPRGTWSGNAIATWQASPVVTLSAGPHTLKWVYAKDASVSVGSDAVYIDGLVTPAFTPAP